MRFYQFDDPFKNKQPPKDFIEDLTRPMHDKAPSNWNKRERKEGEIFVSSLKLCFDFPDNEGLLDTIYEDFKSFMACSNIKQGEDGIILKTTKGQTPCKEAYIIDVTENQITITADDTEGIRRALIHIEDLMTANEGAFLKLGKIERQPFMKTRISRCFFSPPSHNDNHGMVNELEDDNVDYYPEAYLNRLMHDGINGLWIGANFRDILKSDIFPENGANAEKCLKKLKAISDRCRKYGIGIYIFSVEPASTYRNPALEKRTDLHGGSAWGGAIRLFCTSTPEFTAYVKECVTRLWQAVPHLAGFINITVGEACSGCGSTVIFDCPRCNEKFGTRGKTLAVSEKIFADAMKEVAPEAEFISWTYAQRGWDTETFHDSLEERDSGVIHMQNFEDFGKQMQLGRERTLYDYWLAYVGPGKIMTDSLEVNKRRGIKTYAKLQICTSFDFSSVPYVPAPGILFDKFLYMSQNGISGALLCWYFGNYPGLMNKAACELAFTDFNKGKRAFLEELASYYWGSDAKKVASAWEKFEESYKNIPLSKSFEWFSPLCDAPVRPLHLKPVDVAMPSSWKYIETVDSDRIGEALLDGHTIEEAELLTSTMKDLWTQGIKLLEEACDQDSLACIDQKAIAKTIQILIDSGNNLIRFYLLRRLLGIGKGSPSEILDLMEEIVLKEKEHSRELIPLREKFRYLGYMSEANGFKFFEEKLLWRIGELDKLIKTEFPEIRARIEKGLPPLTFYLGQDDGARVCEVFDGDIENATPLFFLDEEGKESKFTFVQASQKGEQITLRFTMADSENDTLSIRPEFRMFHPSAPFSIGKGKMWMGPNPAYSFADTVYEQRVNAIKCTLIDNTDGKEVYDFIFNRSDLGMENNEPFRLSINRLGKHKDVTALDDRIYARLNLGKISPDSYIFFVKR
ncbi:MAG: hypothetical protein IJC07_04960 [Clostridia bacterium]|nr:hypothetical protein [Clostridia bacterium]